jgi:hypothetical protein
MLLVENTISFLTQEWKRQDITIPHSIGKWMPSLGKTWASSFSRTPSTDFKKTDTSNACLKCPAVKGTEIWAAMKCGKARMFGFRTYPQGRFEVFVRR